MQIIKEAMMEQDIMTTEAIIGWLEKYPTESVIKILKETLKDRKDELQKIKETNESN